jgi:hypothetical protein
MGSIEEIKTKQKHKFPQIDGKRARKGFMRTRWLLKGIEIDLMNVHLFHDPNNLESISRSPSQYAIQRREALNYALQAIGNEDTTPLFVFGGKSWRARDKKFIYYLL